MEDLKTIILNNYINNKDNINDYYNYFKMYKIKILALRTDKRSGIIEYQKIKKYFYILNNTITIE